MYNNVSLLILPMIAYVQKVSYLHKHKRNMLPFTTIYSKPFKTIQQKHIKYSQLFYCYNVQDLLRKHDLYNKWAC